MNRSKLAGVTLLSTLAVISTLSSRNVFAETETATSTTTEKTGPPSFFQKVTIGYYGVWNGPSLGYVARNENSPYLPKDDGSPDFASKTYLSSGLTFAYKTDSGFTPGVTVNFDATYMGGAGVVMQDPAIKIGKPNILKIGDLTMSGDLRFYLPVSSTSIAKNSFTTMRTLQVFNYEISGTRWTLGALFFQKLRFNGPVDGSFADTEVYAGPNIAYKISNKVSATIWYELDANHSRGTSWLAWNNAGTDLQTGVSWDVTPNFTLNPYIQTYPLSTLSLDSTTVGAYIIAKFI